MIRFYCSQCSKRLKVAPEHVGRKVRCPRCGHGLIVPAQSEAEPRKEASAQVKVDGSALPAEQREPFDPIRFSQPRPTTDEDMDMTPMVDVVFLLLIFFMVTAAFSFQRTIQVPPPDVTDSVAQARTLEELEEEEDYIIVRIERDNTVWVEGSEAPSSQELLAKLREARDTRGRRANTMLAVASGEALHEAVVTVLDAGTAVGMNEVRLSTADDEDTYF